MNSKRRKLIIAMILDYINMYYEDVEQYYENQNPQADDHESDLKELDFNNRLIFAPQSEEFEILQTKGKNGNWRTKQIVQLALDYAQNDMENVQNEYPYQGEQERFLDTHVSFDEINFKMPTQQEFKELEENINLIVKSMPPINLGNIAWDVFGPDEDGTEILIDTVFYDANCDSQYVKKGLVDHDGYDPSIIVVPRSRDLYVQPQQR